MDGYAFGGRDLSLKVGESVFEGWGLHFGGSASFREEASAFSGSTFVGVSFPIMYRV